MEEYFSSDRILELSIGAVVQAHSEDDQKLHFALNLVGADRNKSIITTLPARKYLPGNANYESIFTPDRLFEMRTIHDGRIVAFESAVIAIYDKRLLIGSFPEMIETRRLRSHTRYPCALSCDIRLNGNESYGVITNISSGGCQLSVKKDNEYAFIQEAMETQASLELEVFFPPAEIPVIIEAQVKSAVCQIEGDCKVGLSFKEKYEYVRQYLESLHLDSVEPFFS